MHEHAGFDAQKRADQSVPRDCRNICIRKPMVLLRLVYTIGSFVTSLPLNSNVKKGKRYILFPEGGYDFNNRNNVCNFKAGSFKIALKTKAPIIPVALIDSYKVFNSFNLGPVTTQVHYLKPILFDEYGSLKTHEIAELVQRRIQEKIDSILLPET